LLVRRGLKDQPYKVGPDYIDPTHHTEVTVQTTRNQDTWLLTHDAVRELFHRAMKGKDIAVIEGVMGLFDGHSATGDEGSTAEVAKLLGVPVLLVVDCAKTARSIAALVRGYRDFDERVRIVGVVLNNVGSERHLKMCREAIEMYSGLPVLGHLPRREALRLPERHLGLIPTDELKPGKEFLETLLAHFQTNFDLERILTLCPEVPENIANPSLFPDTPQPPRVRIGVAKDIAFTFYYPDSLDLLEAWGAELANFSPLEDSTLPDGISGLYIGGGFPELYAEQLADNAPIKEAIRTVIRQGMPVYAECGGLMYLSREIRDLQGQAFPMVNAIPVTTQIDSPRLRLGYRTVKALNDSPLLERGQSVRGHEFHWSVACYEDGAQANAYEVDPGGKREGFQVHNALASYVHLHLGSEVRMAKRFIDQCRRFRDGQTRG
ncbi:MAG: cobyrinate a,c-diamide synthase, partial [Chloroflexi bacterium]|nr:cobyrinate a,c-diamide synthase [Chloroflexota bacterium]